MHTSRWARLRTTVFLFLAGLVRGMTLGARAAILDGDRVFLIRHTYVPGWHMPGGGVGRGETVRQAMEREVLEETGHRVAGEAELFGFYFNRRASRGDHVALFVCRQVEQMREITPNHEISEAGWFSRHELPEGTGLATRRRLAEIFGEAPRADEW